jgi:YggT family protein
MLTHILTLVLEVVASLIAGAALLRLYFQFHHIPMSLRSGNPFAAYIFYLTNWSVMPLRRILPTGGRLDLSSLLVAFLVLLIKCIILGFIGVLSPEPIALLVDALYELMNLCLSSLSTLVLVYALLSWFSPTTPMFDLLQRMVFPLLAPIRRLMPATGALDLSPLILLLLLQIAEIALRDLHVMVLQLIWSQVN